MLAMQPVTVVVVSSTDGQGLPVCCTDVAGPLDVEGRSSKEGVPRGASSEVSLFETKKITN